MDEKALKARMLQRAVPIEKYVATRINNERQHIVGLATRWYRQAMVITNWFGVPIATSCRAVAMYKITQDAVWQGAYALLVNHSPEDLFAEIRFNFGTTTRAEAGEAIAVAGSNVWEQLGMPKVLTLNTGDSERILTERWHTYSNDPVPLGELAPPIGSDEGPKQR